MEKRFMISLTATVNPFIANVHRQQWGLLLFKECLFARTQINGDIKRGFKRKTKVILIRITGSLTAVSH